MSAVLTSRPSSALPAPTDPLVGREDDVRAVRSLVQNPRVRLVTLTGPGGVGKTRLALAVAAELVEVLRDGVWFVSLAPVRDPALVLPAVAQALGVQEAGLEPIGERLEAYLRPKRALVVLDNVEQVVGAANDVARLLASCPELTILATSRMVLRVRGEHEYAVLPLPAAAQNGDPASVPAVRLFVERAAAVAPGFRLTAHNSRTVAAICERLEGLPLAIELAAVRLNVLTPEALLTRLERRLPLLTGGPRDAPRRQQTLRDAIGWSYDLLSEEERRFFRRLAVFVGGFTFDAVAAVLEERDPLDGISSLVEKSLVRLSPAIGSPRYTMLETVREFGLERLEAEGELDEARASHATAFLSYAERAEPALGTADQLRWLDGMDAELGNLRAALEWFRDRGPAERLLRLAGALGEYWMLRYLAREGIGWLQEALTRAPDAPAAQRAKALGALARLASKVDLALAESAAAESLLLWTELNDHRQASRLLALQARLAALQDAGTPTLQRSAAALEHARRSGNPAALANALQTHGHLLFEYRGDSETALPLLEEALAIARSVGDRSLLHGVLTALGETIRGLGDHATAAVHYDESLRHALELNKLDAVVVALCNLGHCVLYAGEVPRAKALFDEAFRTARDAGIVMNLHCGVIGLAAVAGAEGKAELAARLFGAAQRLSDQLRLSFQTADRLDYERELASARSLLDPDTFARLFEEGRQLTPEDVASLMAHDGAPSRQPARLALNGLSEREIEVLCAVAGGLTNAEVADQLIISAHTVNAHLRSIYEKLGVHSRGAAIRWAADHGLLDAPTDSNRLNDRPRRERLHHKGGQSAAHVQ